MGYSTKCYFCRLWYFKLVHVTYRLKQPGQNPINENTNILWNSQSLGKNTASTEFIKRYNNNEFWLFLTHLKQWAIQEKVGEWPPYFFSLK